MEWRTCCISWNCSVRQKGAPGTRSRPTRASAGNMLEEAYEAVEAIDEEDPEHLKEELGDVLLQVVFHACMAAEEGLFTFDDVVDGVAKKMVFRHPHVFGTVRAEDSVQALDTWDAQKREEKAQRTATDTLEAVARSLPALIRAEKVQIKAAKAGFDWPDREPALTSWRRRWTSFAAPPAGTETRRRNWATCSLPR